MLTCRSLLLTLSPFMLILRFVYSAFWPRIVILASAEIVFAMSYSSSSSSTPTPMARSMSSASRTARRTFLCHDGMLSAKVVLDRMGTYSEHMMSMSSRGSAQKLEDKLET